MSQIRQLRLLKTVNQRSRYDAADRPEASSATRPCHKTRASVAKKSSSRATFTVATAKTAKLDANKKKRKRKASPTLTIPTPSSRELKEKDEGTAVRRLLMTSRRRCRHVPRPRGSERRRGS